MPRFIPSATLLYMAGNLDRRAAQHDELGDEMGAIKYRRLADQCREEANGIPPDPAPRAAGAVDGVGRNPHHGLWGQSLPIR